MARRGGCSSATWARCRAADGYVLPLPLPLKLDPDPDLTLAQVACGSDKQIARARGYASKLLRIVEDVAKAPPGVDGLPLKTLVLVHRSAGYKLLLRMAAKRFGLGAVRGFPPARTAAERSDPALLELLGGPHDEQAPPTPLLALTLALTQAQRGSSSPNPN